jgi:hypothetical protein
MRWLILVHAKGPTDARTSSENLKSFRKNMRSADFCYVIWTGHRGSSAVTIRMSKTKMDRLDSERLGAEETYAPKLLRLGRRLADRIRKTGEEPISGFCYSGHGSSSVIGPWKRWRVPFLSIAQLGRLIKPWKPRIVLFDSCYGGTINCLFNLPSFCSVAVASPASHPSILSMLQTKSMARSAKPIDQDGWLKLGCRIAAEFETISRGRPNFRCLLVFDLPKVRELAKVVKQRWPSLVFDRRSLAVEDDGNLYDLHSAARNLPDLQRSLASAVANFDQAVVGRHRCRPCKRIRTMTTEARPQKKWQDLYNQSKFGRLIRLNER